MLQTGAATKAAVCGRWWVQPVLEEARRALTVPDASSIGSDPRGMWCGRAQEADGLAGDPNYPASEITTFGMSYTPPSDPITRWALRSSLSDPISFRSITLKGQVSAFPPLRITGRPISSSKSSAC